MRELTLLVALLLVIGGPVGAAASPEKTVDREAGCAKNPSLVGPCFTVQGLAVIANGTPSFRIIQNGSKRSFGVLPAEKEIVPRCLARAVRPDFEVNGEFNLCPFTAAKEGQMQMVCVESVGDFTARQWSKATRTYVVGPPTPGCAVGTEVFARGWRSGTPSDVVDLVERYGGCNHWGGEEGYNEERRKEIEDAVKSLKCDRLDADQRRLRKKYAHRPKALRVIEAASTYEND